jgi:arginyl-tRNA synthetase
MIAAAANSLEPHKVLTFCGELIAEFHSYYTRGKQQGWRVISEDKALTQARLAMIAALKQTLKNAFLMIGVDAPDRMDSKAPEDDD